MKTDEAFGRDLNLLAAGDGVGAGTDTAAGSCADGCSLATAEDATEDSADGRSAADLFGCVFAAAFAFDAVRFGGDRDFSPRRLMLVSSTVSRELPL